MGLSLNPMSWTPSNLAESAVEFVTGSEAAGDIAGLWMAGATGDVKGLAEQSADLGQNIAAGGKKLLEGFCSALKDAFQVFSNPGAVKPPEASQCQAPGYADGTPASQTDTGAVGNSSGPGAPTVGSGSESDIDKMLDGPGSIEDKIFALLMHLQKEKKGEVADKMKSMKGMKGDDRADMLQELQKSTGELSQLTQLTTGLMQNFKQMKDSVIQNIR